MKIQLTIKLRRKEENFIRAKLRIITRDRESKKALRTVRPVRSRRHSHIHFFKINLFILFIFIFGCIGSLLWCAGFLWLQRAGATLHYGAWASHCSGFSYCGARALARRLQ